ncbi:hypothetical protein MMC30_007815 [Trapelia coarctata]|nr:hypothetical protein [Trapelia coarctata]
METLPSSQPLQFYTPGSNCLEKELPSHTRELAVFEKVDSLVLEIHNSSHDQKWWWYTTGQGLAILMHEAGYSVNHQYSYLWFYATYVVPVLGPVPKTLATALQWHSFMTDDGTPIELSWDWGWQNEPRVIRYSIEPIGPSAGTAMDPLNKRAGVDFVRGMQSLLPKVDLTWFNHLTNELLDFHPRNEVSRATTEPESHKSGLFVAFDLRESDVMLKVYFFPCWRAVSQGISNLDAIKQAVSRLPCLRPSDIPSFDTLCGFLQKRSEQSYTAEMLAIDCVAPLKSRVKIYVRSRSTDFQSVLQTMSLGGLMRSEEMDEGFQQLQELWNLVFGFPDSHSATLPLDNKDHRTAGILYCFEIRPGETFPVAKVYIPVRHYAPNDAAIAKGLASFLKRRGQDSRSVRYARALKEILRVSTRRPSSGINTNALKYSPSSDLNSVCGGQTYVGCVVKGNQLKIISYLNPQVYRFLPCQ